METMAQEQAVMDALGIRRFDGVLGIVLDLGGASGRARPRQPSNTPGVAWRDVRGGRMEGSIRASGRPCLRLRT
jgi:hypothetical protein